MSRYIESSGLGCGDTGGLRPSIARRTTASRAEPWMQLRFCVGHWSVLFCASERMFVHLACHFWGYLWCMARGFTRCCCRVYSVVDFIFVHRAVIKFETKVVIKFETKKIVIKFETKLVIKFEIKVAIK